MPSLVRLVLASLPLLKLFASALPGAPMYDSPPIEPKEPIQLFPARDLSAFYTWLPDSGYADTDPVFQVVDQIDGGPAIRVSGQHDGGLVTRANYTNYRLVVEFRHGNILWAPRTNYARFRHPVARPRRGRRLSPGFQISMDPIGRISNHRGRHGRSAAAGRSRAEC